jgi:hypothetical protein
MSHDTLAVDELRPMRDAEDSELADAWKLYYLHIAHVYLFLSMHPAFFPSRLSCDSERDGMTYDLSIFTARSQPLHQASRALATR